MKPKLLCLFDHRGEDAEDYVGNLDPKLLHDAREKAGLGVAPRPSAASVVLGHFLSPKEEIQRELPDYPNGQRVIVVSRDPASFESEDDFPHKRDDSHARRVRYCLFVRNEALLHDPEVLSRVLRLSVPEAETIVDKKGADALGWKCDPFKLHTLEVLSALSILCQGYLAAHADRKGVPELGKALEKMGWSDAIRNGSIDLAIEQQAMRRVNEVNKASWWTKIFEGARPGESDLGLRGSPIPRQIQTLVERIFDRDEKIEPAVVASAYLAITALLE